MPYTIVRDHYPGLAQQHPVIDNQHRQAQQQQPQRRIARAGPRPHLMHLPVASLNPKAPPVEFKDCWRFHPPQPIDGIGEVLHSAPPFVPLLAAVLADNHYLGGVSLTRPALEAVARPVSAPPTKQLLDPTRFPFAPRRN